MRELIWPTLVGSLRGVLLDVVLCAGGPMQRKRSCRNRPGIRVRAGATAALPRSFAPSSPARSSTRDCAMTADFGPKAETVGRARNSCQPKIVIMATSAPAPTRLGRPERVFMAGNARIRPPSFRVKAFSSLLAGLFETKPAGVPGACTATGTDGLKSSTVPITTSSCSSRENWVEAAAYKVSTSCAAGRSESYAEHRGSSGMSKEDRCGPNATPERKPSPGPYRMPEKLALISRMSPGRWVLPF